MGFFSKKPAAPVTPAAKAAPASPPIAITGVGLACHAGDQPFALISSIIGQMSGVQISDEHTFRNDDGVKETPRMAPVEDIADIRSSRRIEELTLTALANVEVQLPADIDPDKLLIVLMVNPERLTNVNKNALKELQEYLTDKTIFLEKATFRILPNTSTAISELRASIAELNEGQWDALIFGGTDTLISMDACLKLDEEKRLNTVNNSDGIIPGEAAAFVVLQSTEQAANNPQPPLGYLRGLGVAAEPNAREADLDATLGLSSAINQALTQAGITATDIKGIVHNLGCETVQAYEWYQTTQTLWPRSVSEQQRMAVQLGEIKNAAIPDDPIPKILLPYMTMGEVGAASLPIHLATALAWLEYDAWHARWGFPVREHLLVCETPETAERGALIISTTLAAKT